MNIPEIQDGWRFYTADFSVPNEPGSVTLIREETNQARWHLIVAGEPDEKKWPELYASGRGMTLASAVDKANVVAAANGSNLPVPNNRSSATPEKMP